MGVGTPPDLLHAIGCGVDMFDCVLPTHLAWQGTAFTSTGRVRVTRGAERARRRRRSTPRCACSTCRDASAARYLHHLFKCSEPLGPRLLSHPQPAPLPAADARGARRHRRRRLRRRSRASGWRRSIATSTPRCGVSDAARRAREPRGRAHARRRAGHAQPRRRARSCTRASGRSSRPSSSTSGSRACDERLTRRGGPSRWSSSTSGSAPARTRSRRAPPPKRSPTRRGAPRARQLRARPRRARAGAASTASAFGCDGEPADAARALLADGAHETRAHALAARPRRSPRGARARDGARRHRLLGSVLAARQPGAVDGGRVRGARRVAGPRCALYTYSASTATRLALLLAGWAVGVGDAIGDKAQTTAAAVGGQRSGAPARPRWLARLSRARRPPAARRARRRDRPRAARPPVRLALKGRNPSLSRRRYGHRAGWRSRPPPRRSSSRAGSSSAMSIRRCLSTMKPSSTA